MQNMKKISGTKEDKKIGIMIDFLNFGGVEKVAVNQVFALNKIGIDADLLVLRRTKVSDTHPFKKILDQIPIVYLDDKLPKFLKFSFKIPFFSFFSIFHITYPFFIPWVVKTKDYSAVVSHGTYTSFTAFSLKKFKKIPYLMFLWDPIFYILNKRYSYGPINTLKFIFLPIAKFIDRLLIKNADRIFLAGSAHVDYVNKTNPGKITFLYPGVENSPKYNENREDYVISATAWKEGKDPEYLLKVLKELPEAKLVMAGGWYPPEMKDLFMEKVKDSGLLDRVEVTGAVSEERLRKLYSNALVFLHISDDRGFGMGALEAASCGCPFVIPEHQGVGELFDSGSEGFVTKEKDTSKIVSHLRNLLDNPKVAEKMGRRAWEKVNDSYTWEKHAYKLNSEVLKVLSND